MLISTTKLIASVIFTIAIAISSTAFAQSNDGYQALVTDWRTGDTYTVTRSSSLLAGQSAAIECHRGSGAEGNCSDPITISADKSIVVLICSVNGQSSRFWTTYSSDSMTKQQALSVSMDRAIAKTWREEECVQRYPMAGSVSDSSTNQNVNPGTNQWIAAAVDLQDGFGVGSGPDEESARAAAVATCQRETSLRCTESTVSVPEDWIVVVYSCDVGFLSDVMFLAASRHDFYTARLNAAAKIETYNLSIENDCNLEYRST